MPPRNPGYATNRTEGDGNVQLAVVSTLQRALLTEWFFVFQTVSVELSDVFSHVRCTRLTERLVFSPTESLRNVPRRSIIIANAEQTPPTGAI